MSGGLKDYRYLTKETQMIQTIGIIVMSCSLGVFLVVDTAIFIRRMSTRLSGTTYR